MPSSFITLLKVTPMPDGRHWELLEEFIYDLGYKGSDFNIRVPKGFITDFASVPKFLWWLISNWGKHGKAAVLHDWLYKIHMTQFRPTRPGYLGEPRAITREWADAVLLEAMEVLGVTPWKMNLIYRAVRIFGGFAWRGHESG